MNALEAVRAGVLKLLPERAVFAPAAKTLFVADLHLGKAATFRSSWRARADRRQRGDACAASPN